LRAIFGDDPPDDAPAVPSGGCGNMNCHDATG
jgi:hypothetical protein